MKKRKVKGFYDKTAGTELRLYAENDYDLYKRETAIVNNYKRKIKKGTFNMVKAEKGVFNLLVTPAARKYTKEFGGNSRTMFPSATRKGVAKGKARDIFRGILRGEYD